MMREMITFLELTEGRLSNISNEAQVYRDLSAVRVIDLFRSSLRGDRVLLSDFGTSQSKESKYVK